MRLTSARLRRLLRGALEVATLELGEDTDVSYQLEGDGLLLSIKQPRAARRYFHVKILVQEVELRVKDTRGVPS